MTKQQLSEAVASTFPEKTPSAKGLITNMIWSFYHEIVLGDFIIARRGLKVLVGVGNVTQSAIYAPGKNPFLEYPNFLGVSWQDKPRDKFFPSVVFPRYTVAETSEEQFRKYVESSDIISAEEKEGVEDQSAFVLEKYLEDFILNNFETIFKRELTIYKDTEGNEGQQYATDVGPIDILAVKNKSRSFVVMELKKGRPSDQVVGQILRYMGWVKENLCTDGQSVKGLVICREPDPKLTYAMKMINNVDVRYYEVSFKLKEVS
jgi:restriction system protein